MLIKRDEFVPAVSLDLTPIIDMVFLLLIFFLVATTFNQIEREMKIVLPQAASAGPISMNLRELIVNVDAQGAIIVAGNRLSEADLRELVSQAVGVNPNQKVTIRGDQSASYASIAAVLDICKSAGIQEPYLDTVPIR